MKLDYDEELFDYNGDGVLDVFERDDYEEEQLREMREILHPEPDDFPIPDAYNAWTDFDDESDGLSLFDDEEEDSDDIDDFAEDDELDESDEADPEERDAGVEALIALNNSWIELFDDIMNEKERAVPQYLGKKEESELRKNKSRRLAAAERRRRSLQTE